ncbi:uncharacterized protein LOC111349697 isoform X2 [Spodoptera litura]|uniref:Uncharacterized protein LOC111349697 isoform X2 n=1 Tax=Spodoptera litura TaxID=69820 RepID=A0A9J7DQP3_SPOLT|nr:uncharacterized protein LOC111349697 isoform X2 [Spodoptera litura]
MYCLKFLVSVAFLILISQEENEVSAAPCKWMWDHITHTHPTTTPPTSTASTTTMTTAKPDLIEDFARLKKKKVKQWDELLWGPQNENSSSRPRNPVKRIISSYVKLLTKLFSMLSA